MERYNDSELVYLMRCGSQVAQEYLYRSYYEMVERWVLSYTINNDYMEKDDCIQIAMMHFDNIIDSYREDQMASLRTYMYLSLKKRMLNHVYQLQRKKRKQDCQHISLDATVSDNDGSMRYDELIEDPQQRHYPRISLMIKEHETIYQSFIDQNTTQLEKNVVALKQRGYDDKEIAEKMEISLKCVYNAAYRYHKKLQSIDVEK